MRVVQSLRCPVARERDANERSEPVWEVFNCLFSFPSPIPIDFLPMSCDACQLIFWWVYFRPHRSNEWYFWIFHYQSALRDKAHGSRPEREGRHGHFPCARRAVCLNLRENRDTNGQTVPFLSLSMFAHAQRRIRGRLFSSRARHILSLARALSFNYVNLSISRPAHSLFAALF